MYLAATIRSALSREPCPATVGVAAKTDAINTKLILDEVKASSSPSLIAYGLNDNSFIVTTNRGLHLCHELVGILAACKEDSGCLAGT